MRPSLRLPILGYYVCVEQDEFYFGYLIDGRRLIRPFSTDDLASEHWDDRVHQFPDKRSARDWLNADPEIATKCKGAENDPESRRIR